MYMAVPATSNEYAPYAVTDSYSDEIHQYTEVPPANLRRPLPYGTM
jgi:hypothetical protein